MIIKTPVLIRERYNDYYQNNEMWACGDVLARLFVYLPGKIILRAGTRPDPEAVKVHLEIPWNLGSFEIDNAEAGAQMSYLFRPLMRLRRRFLAAGHRTIYLSMIDCD